MNDALLFVSVGALLTLGAATLVIAALALRNARRYVELAEVRMERLREEQARLTLFVREERRTLEEELGREREQRLEAQRRAARTGRERVPLRRAHRTSAEGFDAEPPEGDGHELRARRDLEHRIDELKREFEQFRDAQRERERERKSHSPVPRATSEDMPKAGEVLDEGPFFTGTGRGEQKAPRPASSPEESRSSESAGSPPEGEKPRRAVWHPHPDDDVSPVRAPAGRQAHPLGGSPVEMFRRRYDKYLENYEGYVKLLERIYRMRDDAEMPPGSLAKRQWEDRLRRANDGIERTTARLDLLEEYNPELATDDRISRRASIARSYSELQKGEQGRRRFLP